MHLMNSSLYKDLGRGLLLSENPHLRARFQIVHRRRDERRKVLAWRGRALSGYRLPSDGSFTRPLTPAAATSYSTPDIYLTTITSSQGLCQPHSLLVPKHRHRLTVLAWQDLGRGLLLSENPHLRARFQIVHRRRDERRKVLAWRGRALSGYRLPSDGSFTRPLTPCCCYVVSTPDIYLTTITSSQGLCQPHSLLVPKHRHAVEQFSLVIEIPKEVEGPWLASARSPLLEDAMPKTDGYSSNKQYASSGQAYVLLLKQGDGTRL
ncbi:hypothetical protein MRX96_051006 [Rhipicephalus microplus]